MPTITVSDFLTAKGRHFVALEYYWIMLNRTFLILLTDDSLIGLKAGGVISAEGGRDGLTRAINHSLAVKGDLHNPYSYVKASYTSKYEQAELSSEALLALDKENFTIPYQSISAVAFDKSKKWGMGNYPHDGKILVTTKDGKKRELIILGNQSGESIRQQIDQAVGL